MPLSIAERKHRLPHGSQREVARELGCTEGFVSGVVNETFEPRTPATERKVRRVKVAIARKLGMRVDDAFPPKVEQPVEQQIAGVA